MPYGPGDAKRHNKKATTPRLRRAWAEVWNKVHAATGDEARAFREANAAVDQAIASRAGKR